MHRVLVVGTTGSGKTTVARALAEHLDAPHIELDALHWEPGWVEASTQTFRDRALAATAGDRWVVCGNYWSKLDDLLWTRADTVVWLDLPLPIILWRLVRRTVSRSLRRTELWGSNRERISGLWSKNSLLLWAIKSHPKNRVRYAAAIADPRWAHISFFALRSQREIRTWVTSVRTKPTDAAVVLRPAQVDDAEEVAGVYLRSRHQLVSFAPLAHPDDDVRVWIRDRLIPSGEVTVGVQDGEVKGMLAVSKRDGFGWIDQLYVDPDRVGTGIGTELLQHAIATLGEPIRLFTFQANERARRFYERRGFRAVRFTDGADNEERCPDVLYEYP